MHRQTQTSALREPQGMRHIRRYPQDVFCLGAKHTTGPPLIVPDSLDDLPARFRRSHPVGYLDIPSDPAMELLRETPDHADSFGVDTLPHLG